MRMGRMLEAGAQGIMYPRCDNAAEAAEVVRWANDALVEVATLEDYVTLVGELAVYLNRVDYWVDQKIPWATFGPATIRR